MERKYPLCKQCGDCSSNDGEVHRHPTWLKLWDWLTGSGSGIFGASHKMLILKSTTFRFGENSIHLAHLLKSKMRKRRQDDDEEQGHPGPTDSGEETDPFLSQHSPQGSHPEEKPSKRLCKRPALLRVAYMAVIGTLVYASIRGYYALELYLDDPFLEAKLITPWEYLTVRYLQSKPKGPPRKFRMNFNTTLVINLDRDVERFRNFQRVNAVKWDEANGPKNNNTHVNSRNGEYYQRFSAYPWQPPKSQANNVSNHQLKEQEAAMREYPFLRNSVKRGEWGNAGCTYSHIQLLEQLQERGGGGGGQYYMVFEDDARISPELIDSGLVEAPPDADIVLLIPTSTKTVRIPYKYGNDGYAIRVTQSYGSFAYVVTTLGAEKLLRHLRGTGHDDPIDVAMHRAKGMRMYQPTNGWPKAHHGTYKSTRSAANSNPG